MPIEDVRFIGVKLGVIRAGVMELLPFVANARHAREAAAHDFRPFAAHHDDSVTIVVQFPDRHTLQRLEESHADITVLQELQSIRLFWYLMSRQKRGPHYVFRNTPGAFIRKMPKSIARMPIVDVLARTDADPGSSSRIVIAAVERLGRFQQFAARQIFAENLASQVCGMQSFRRIPGAPPKLRKRFRRVVIRPLLALHARHEVFEDVVDRFDMIAARAQRGAAHRTD